MVSEMLPDSPGVFCTGFRAEKVGFWAGSTAGRKNWENKSPKYFPYSPCREWLTEALGSLCDAPGHQQQSKQKYVFYVLGFKMNIFIYIFSIVF